MKLSPGNTASFDVAFHQFVPCKMGFGHSPVSIDTRMHNGLNSRIDGRIHQRFTLLNHCERGARSENESINSRQGIGKGQRVIESR